MPDEQIAFLRRFYEEHLGVSAKSTAVVKDIMIRDRAEDAVFSAKTGAGVSVEFVGEDDYSKRGAVA